MQAVRVKLGRVRQPGSQRSNGSDDDIHLLVPELPQCGCTSLLNISVRCEPGIRVGFPCGKLTHAIRAGAVEFTVKVRGIRSENGYCAILRRNDDQRTPDRLPESCNEKCLGTSRKTGNRGRCFAPQYISCDPTEIYDPGNATQ